MVIIVVCLTYPHHLLFLCCFHLASHTSSSSHVIRLHPIQHYHPNYVDEGPLPGACEVMRTDSETFMRYLKRRGDVDETGYVKDICDIKVPTRIDGKIER